MPITRPQSLRQLRESEDGDKKLIVAKLAKVYADAQAKDGDGIEKMKLAAYELEGQGVSKMMLGSLLKGFLKNGKLGTETLIKPNVMARLLAHPQMGKALWSFGQYADDLMH
jgi:hypothetical protein